MKTLVKVLKKPITSTFIAIIFGFLVSAFVLSLASYNPWEAFGALFKGIFSKPKYISNVIIKATPIILTGLSVAFAFKTGLFNIGAEGQYIAGTVVAVCVGGGQEINTGEAGISEWLAAIKNWYPHWSVHISPNLTDSEYSATDAIAALSNVTEVHLNPDLHLSVSMRSFRAENLSLFVKNMLDIQKEKAIETFNQVKEKYPIVLTRDLKKAKQWLKEKARGSERYGIVVSSQAQRLKPYAIDVKSPMNPIHWFLNGKDDVRSSYFLEDVATEFHVQGLELDWACIAWDGDLRYANDGWKTYEFRGSKWLNIKKEERKQYLINAYRVLLTRARQGMIIVVPDGNSEDSTRKPEYYDATFNYLKSLGIPVIS